MLLHSGRGGSTIPKCCSCSPDFPQSCSALATWLLQKSEEGGPTSTFPEPLQHLLHIDDMEERSRKMAPSWGSLNTLSESYCLQRGKRQGRSISPSDSFLPKKQPQSSFCTGSCITNLACLSTLCQRQHVPGLASPLHGIIVFGDCFHVPSKKYSPQFPC